LSGGGVSNWDDASGGVGNVVWKLVEQGEPAIINRLIRREEIQVLIFWGDVEADDLGCQEVGFMSKVDFGVTGSNGWFTWSNIDFVLVEGKSSVCGLEDW
jgi:hypothetical protein